MTMGCTLDDMCIDEDLAVALETMTCHKGNQVSGRKKRAAVEGLAHLLASRRWESPIRYSIDHLYRGTAWFTYYEILLEFVYNIHYIIVV